MINEISGRKASRKGQIEGDTKEERTANWFKHFQGLLGNPPDIGGQDEEIDQIIEELNQVWGFQLMKIYTETSLKNLWPSAVIANYNPETVET